MKYFVDLTDNDYDKLAHARIESIDIAIKNMEELSKKKGEALYREIINFMAPWNIDFKKIECPVSIWAGALDGQIEKPLFDRFITNYDNPKIHYLDNVGHLLLLDYWANVLDEIVQDKISVSNQTYIDTSE